ncbi:hypothetical protein FQN50_003405 [Emmonsiellopsis sp. PD_5]|nr:hypothetical protein FQN50_003405 [Emmonsiellopsis sp. PD_5]
MRVPYHVRIALTEHVLLPPPDPAPPNLFGLPSHLNDQTTHTTFSLRDSFIDWVSGAAEEEGDRIKAK